MTNDTVGIDISKSPARGSAKRGIEGAAKDPMVGLSSHGPNRTATITAMATAGWRRVVSWPRSRSWADRRAAWAWRAGPGGEGG